MPSRRTRPRAVTGLLLVLLAAACSPLPRGTAVAVAARSYRAVDTLVNVARGKPVRANLTCGSPTEDFYPHSDLVKPPSDRHLQICDASNPALAHNASLMTDGNSSTWWQSTSLQQLKLSGNGVGDRAEVFITLDLGETYYPETITIHMGDTIRPGRLAIMRSADGLNFDPWLYLVTKGNRDCRKFGVARQPEPDSPESVVCREYAQLEPQLYNERITVSLSEVPPSFSDEDLLRWRAVRHLQLRFYDMDLVMGTSGDQFDHYAVSEISVMARCECNGFGKGCEISADSGQYECICSGNTQGRFCQECQPLYNQFPYQPGQPCQGQRVYLTTIGSWSFYKARASGPMTSANVKFTCEAAGMRYPCFASGRCTGGWTPDCIKYDDAFISCETHWVLSFHLCGHDNPYRCEPLDDTFVYMDDWWSDGSACGMKYNTDKWWCVTGANVNNLYALCADLNECEPSPCVHGTCTDDIGGYTCTCENGWEGANCDLTTFSGECYHFSSTALTHQDATQACSAKNGHLVDLTDGQQQSFLANKLIASSGASNWLAIKSAPTAFLYSSGSTFSGQIQWSSSEPAAPCDLCVLLDSSNNFLASTAPCTEQHNYVCQSDLKPCGQNVCQNGGICTSCFNDTAAFCDCPAGFDGKTCEIDIDWCSQVQCPPDWVCQDYTFYFQCIHPAPIASRMTPYQCSSASCPDGMYCTEEGVASFSCKAE